MIKLLYIPTIFGISIEVYFILLLLSIPIYFIFRRLFKKRIASVGKRRIVTWLTTIIITPLIYVLIVITWFLLDSYYPNKDFNRQQWLTEKDERYEFAKNIVNSNLLIGKTKIQVIETLGDDGNDNKSNDWYYDLGFRPEIGNIDPDNLVLTFKNE